MVKIVKQSGHVVDFNHEKLKKSLFKSGASQEIVDEIFSVIEKELYDGITTKKIYQRAFGLLKKKAHPHAAKYNLKTGLQQLGPAGYFFEKYISRLFNSLGYRIKLNCILQGKCISHEIDIVIKKNNQLGMVECKFHSTNDRISDVKVPMYILSRFNDLLDTTFQVFEKDEKLSECYIVTNNRFSSEAESFAECYGLKLISWNYPKEQNIRHIIELNCSYPITCLTTISRAEKDQLLGLDIILVNDLIFDTTKLDKIGVSDRRKRNIVTEASLLCQAIQK